jgi:hypothetical protein
MPSCIAYILIFRRRFHGEETGRNLKHTFLGELVTFIKKI